MKTVKLLDCTLRDGGYVNDWKFGNGSITCIYDRLTESGADILEIGFLDDRRTFDMDRTIQPNTESMGKVFSSTVPKRAMLVAMIDYGTCDISNLQPQSETILDGIRVIFKKENMYKAIDYGKQVMAKGYKLFLQMVSITSYNDQDILDFAKAVNDIEPYAVSLVDTYGLMHKEQAFHYFQLLDKYLKPDISIGYHSHNNFQLAYSNTIEVLNYQSDRTIVADGTLYGMGKSAGNAPIELLAMYMNDNFGKNYDINQMMETINNDILPIYANTPWGYNMLFYIAAKNNCHPNFVKYLIDKRTLSIKAVDDILLKIDPELRLKYNQQYIEGLYMEYLLENVDDTKFIEELSSSLSGKKILLIGPGKSASEERDKIEKYCKDEEPVTISVNYIPDSFTPNYVFISNSKRYSIMVSKITNSNVKVIATSNITSVGKPFDHIVEYGKLISDSNEIWDNALVVLLNLLKEINVKSIVLAGFDGFTPNVEKNYVDTSYDLQKTYDYLSAVNDLLKKKLKDYSKTVDIQYLTKSMYE